MPNVFSCDPEWLEKLKKGQDKLVVATWKDGDPNADKYLESLQKLEGQGIPVFVADVNSCPGLADTLKASGSGETIVFKAGMEVGRLKPSTDADADVSKVREMAEHG